MLAARTASAAPARRYTLEQLEAERARQLLAARKALAIKTLSGCVQYFWPIVGNGPLSWGPYHDIVCDEIDSLFAESDRRRILHAEIMATCTRKEAEVKIAELLAPLPPLLLVVEVPPRSLKSTIVNKVLPAKRWLQRPEEQFFCVSSSDANMIRDGLALRDLVTSAEYQELVTIAVNAGMIPAAFSIRPDQFAKGKFDTTEGGTRQGVSIGSRFTGADADVTIVDDPHDVDDAMSGTPEQTERRMREDVATFRDKVSDRKNHPLWHVTILVMQPVHLLDMGAYLAANGAKVVRFAAEFDPSDPHCHPLDWRTAPGELLDPIRLPREVLDQKRTDAQGGGEYAYATKYLMRRTLKEAGQIRAEWFLERYTCQPEDIASAADEVWLTVDSNVKGGAGHDDTAIQAWALKAGKRYLLSRIARPMSPMEHDQVLDDEIARWRPHLTRHGRGGALIEDAANGAQYLQTRRSRFPFLVAFSPEETPGKDKSKPARADYYIRAAESSVIILPDSSVCPWIGAYVEKLVGWPAIGRDEMDAGSQLHMRWTLAGANQMPEVSYLGGRVY